jgi:acyl transferase domain-containing protein
MNVGPVVLYAGQGCQYAGMTAGLFETNPAFRATLFRADARVRERTGLELIDTLFGRDEAWLGDLAITHPAIFSVQWAATEALSSLGIRPAAVLGASLGEYVALCAAGIYRFEDMLDLVCDQALLSLQTGLSGGMLTVLADAALFEAEPVLFAGCTLASVNFPGHFVVSGSDAAVRECAERLAVRAIATHRLPVPVGFHSSQIDPLADAFRVRASRMERRPASIPCISSARAGDVAQAEIGAAHLWSVARDTVRFSEAFATLGSVAGVIDASPSGTLATFVKYGQKDVLSGRLTALLTPGDATTEKVRWRLEEARRVA